MAVNFLAVMLICVYYGAVVSVGVWAARKMNADSSQQVSRLSVDTRRKQDAAHVLMKLFIANRHLPLWMGVGSMTATWVGGGYLNGTAEAVYRHGILRCHAPLGYAVSLVLGGTFFSSKMRATKPLTMLDPFQHRYGRWMALLLCFPAVIGEVFWTAAILAALGDTAGAIIEVDTRFFILASALVVFFYTSLGGVYVVTHTDVLQLVSTTACLWICVPFCLSNHAVGVMGPPHSDWVGTIDSSGVSQHFDAFLMTALGGIPWQVYFQRVLSCETDFHARMLSYLAAVGCIALAVPPAAISAVAKSANFTAAGYPGPHYLRDKDIVRVLPYSIRYLTTGLVSLMGLIGITAAIMSSADSSMLSASSMVTKNVYQSIVRPLASDVEVSLVLRVMVFAIGAWATYLALSVNSVFELWLLCSDIVYVLLFPQLICVLYFEDSNTYGAVLAFFVSVVFRGLCGEPSMNVPVTIRLPMYDEELGQQFPFRLTCMLLGLLTHLLGSYGASLAFRSGWLPQSFDVFKCFSLRHSESKQAAKPSDHSAGASGNATGAQQLGGESNTKNEAEEPPLAKRDDVFKIASFNPFQKLRDSGVGSIRSQKPSSVDGSPNTKKASTADASPKATVDVQPLTSNVDGFSGAKKKSSSKPARRAASATDVAIQPDNLVTPVAFEAKARSSTDSANFPSSAKSDTSSDSKASESKPDGDQTTEPTKAPSLKVRRSRSRAKIEAALSAAGSVSKSDGEPPQEGGSREKQL
ncbi:high-affinity choline transporter 1-like isoform X1 [Dermacentor albipictus]|uniref:high-affinity choline transporter 1-like isoform X1 n=1 Tax=Dermacentor albipictus TaxID=60249 RepID=UPI0031FC2EC2